MAKKKKKKKHQWPGFERGWNVQSLLILPFNHNPQKTSWQEAVLRKSRAAIVCVAVPLVPQSSSTSI